MITTLHAEALAWAREGAPTPDLPAATAQDVRLREDVLAAQQGDQRATARLIETYHPRIARLVYAILLNTADVDDVAQQIFIRMCQRLSTLRDPAVFEAWLFQMARRASLDHLRREKFRRLWSPLEALQGEPATSHLSPSRGDTIGAEDVRALLVRLPVSDRELIFLSGEGHTYEAIAALQGRSRASVKARLARVREWLRRELAAEG